MNLINKKTFILLFFPLLVFSQNSKIENLKKEYHFEQNKSGFCLLTDKNNSRKIKIADKNGEIIYSNDKNEHFIGLLECNKFFIGTPLRSGNDVGGYTREDYIDIKLYHLMNLKTFSAVKYSFLSDFSRRKFQKYKIFDTSDKVGLINSCGEVVVEPKYSCIGDFNDVGQAVAFTNSDYTVIDTLGNSLLKQPFKHSLELNPKYAKYSIPFNENIKDNRVISTNVEGKLFGIFDFKFNKQLIPNSYDEVSQLEEVFYKVRDEKTKNDIPYEVKKNNLIALIDYLNFKEILPMSVEANGATSVSQINNKYVIIFYKTKKVIKQTNANITELLSVSNVYYDGKTLFDPKLEIKDIKIYKNRFITLQLYNGGSMIYDLEKSKFIATFSNDLVTVENYQSCISVSNTEDTYDAKDIIFNVSIPCKGENCQTSSSTKGALCDYNGSLKTSFLQDASYTVVQLDKNQNKFLYLVYNRPSNFVLDYNLYDNDGKLVLEHLDIRDNAKEYSVVTKNGVLVLNEEIEKSNVYGKTAFDIDGKMIGERYMYSSPPSKVKPKKEENVTTSNEAQKTNRFLKK